MFENAGDGFNGVEYWENKFLLYDSLAENWGAEATIGLVGQDLFDALSARLDADLESKEYQAGYKIVWRLLTWSSMQKVTHGKHLTKGIALGILWDMEGNEGIDVKPGTFAELLLYGSAHFEQTRKDIEYRKVPKPDELLKRGLLEA